MSRQLRILREAGIIRELPVPHDRRGALFGLNPAEIGRIVAWLAGTEVGLDERVRAGGRKLSAGSSLAEELAREPDVAASLRGGDWRMDW